ncbi:hypothetical protein C1I60_14075 [Paenibacillus terrae]|uniref:HTH LytTR-type domain-containing protein n=1 Tax=Paenibacillus terrae TaxID=159743 RepID=A0A4V5SPY5_9BACL|nr:hypothetical protein C1I60_14075 [Paenibacillus terrae]
MIISVTISPDRGEKLLEVDTILFIESQSSIQRIAMHTFDGVFYTVGPLGYWEMLFNNEGYRFYNVDRSNTINVDKLTGINFAFKLAEFANVQINKKMTCTMAGRRFNKVAEELRVLNPGIVLSR